MSLFPDIQTETSKSAILSTDGVYRYYLTRHWDIHKLALPFVMLNPSTADHTIDDPTIRRCMSFARRENYGGIVVVNLFAYRATDPAELAKAEDRIGSMNYDYLCRVLETCREGDIPIVAAWGAHKEGGITARVFCVMAKASCVALKCLGVTSTGAPRHPLYVRGDQPLVPFE